MNVVGGAKKSVGFFVGIVKLIGFIFPFVVANLILQASLLPILYLMDKYDYLTLNLSASGSLWTLDNQAIFVFTLILAQNLRLILSVPMLLWVATTNGIYFFHTEHGLAFLAMVISLILLIALRLMNKLNAFLEPSHLTLNSNFSSRTLGTSQLDIPFGRR